MKWQLLPRSVFGQLALVIAENSQNRRAVKGS